MRNDTVKTRCSVIQDGWHYKGNVLCFSDDRISIQGIYPCEIAISSIIDFHLKKHILFSDLYITMGTSKCQEKLIIRVPNLNRARLIIKSIDTKRKEFQG